MEAHLDSKKIIESLEIRADSLLATNRFDLGSKLACADWMKHSNSKLLATPLHPIYEAFTRAITQGHFSEPSSEKRGLEDYIESFESLHRKLVKDGFDETQGYIPIADDGSLLNGAHRSAILISEKPLEPVHVKQYDLAPLNYDWRYFANAGVNEAHLDLSARTILEHAQEAFVACLWPVSALHHKAAKEILAPYSFYEKSVTLTDRGKINLMLHLYPRESWIGVPENQFLGSDSKIDACFRGGSAVTLLFLNGVSAKKMTHLKTKIRDLIGLEKNSIHITDNKYEALSIGRTVLSVGGEGWLNKAQPWKYPDFYQEILELGEQSFSDENSYAISGSALCGVFGLRQPEDVDFIYAGENEDAIKSLTEGRLDWSNHRNQLPFYGKSPEALIFDITNINYFLNTRFLAPQIVIHMKKNRGETKDIIDIKLLAALDKSGASLKDHLYLASRRVKSTIRWKLLATLRKAGLYNTAYNIYHKLKP